jgi:hypothetical protein
MIRHACGCCGETYESMQAAILCCDPDFDPDDTDDPPAIEDAYGEAPPAGVPPERHEPDADRHVDIRCDGGHHEGIEITGLPYQCRNCQLEQTVYVNVERLGGERVVDAHNVRLMQTYCDDCHTERVFVLATENADAARDDHPIQPVRELHMKRRGATESHTPIADGGVVESDMEAWIAAGCPEPVAADEQVGDADCDFECGRDADYRVQFDNGHITVCCQPCSVRNRLYAKENDLQENDVHDTDGGQR